MIALGQDPILYKNIFSRYGSNTRYTSPVARIRRIVVVRLVAATSCFIQKTDLYESAGDEEPLDGVLVVLRDDEQVLGVSGEVVLDGHAALQVQAGGHRVGSSGNFWL